MYRNYVLLNPGPVNVSQRVRDALLFPDVCHREPEYLDLQKDIRQKILQAFDLDSKIYDLVLVTGSGTSALDMTFTHILSENKKVLILNNGFYGLRIVEIAKTYRFPIYEVELPWNQDPDLELLTKYLKKDPDIQVIAVVHHETSSGLINPLPQIAELAKRFDKLLFVDSVSGLGGEELDFEKVSPDFVVSTTNKCIQGFPGMAFTIFKKKHLPHMESISPRNFYLNLFQHWKCQYSGQTRFTPAVQIAFAFRAALDELIQETLSKRIERFKKTADVLRKSFEEMDLKFFLPRHLLSNTITSLYLPENISYKTLHQHCKKQGFIIYEGRAQLAQSVFRIANMGWIPDEKILEFSQILRQIFRAS